MACFWLLYMIPSFLCGMVFGMLKTKLKSRYLLLCFIALTATGVFLRFPQGENHSQLYSNNNKRSDYDINHVDHRVPVNGRELLHQKETKYLKVEQLEKEMPKAFPAISKARARFENMKDNVRKDLAKYNGAEQIAKSVDQMHSNDNLMAKEISILQKIDRENKEKENLVKEEKARVAVVAPKHQEKLRVIGGGEDNDILNLEALGLLNLDNSNDDDDNALNSPKKNFAEDDDEDNNQQFRRSDMSHFNRRMQFDNEVLQHYLFDNGSQRKLLPHMNSVEARRKFASLLPWWEIQELKYYERVWFVGENANKTKYNRSSDANYGFDRTDDPDHEGRYKIVKGDHLQYRYKIVKKLGSGSFGSVVLADDLALPIGDPFRQVAIKIMHNDSSSEKYFKREIDMMRLIVKETGAPERYTRTLKTFFFRNHFCIVLELLGNVLDEESDEAITDMRILRKYAIDILSGLVLLHRKKIIHGDLKPDNMMFVRNCNVSCPIYIKIADFNLACVEESEEYPCPGRYFQTRHYRAPEVILDLDYDTTADMWSVGVILAELFLQKVPFYGETTTDQLAAIMEVMGLVPPQMVEESPRIHTYQKAICYKCENGFKRRPYRKNLSSVLKGIPPLLYDFIEKCFELDPRERMTSEEALRHPFLTQTSDRVWKVTQLTS